MKQLARIVVIAGLLAMPGLTADVDDFNPRVVIKRPFPAIVSPKTVSATEANNDLRPQELVIGLEINGEARAYPVNMLCRPNREIVTDTVGGKRVAVTWCHLCHNGLIFQAEHKGKPLTFVVSGMLWKRNLVMRDQETGSLWSHMLGKCMRGKLKGVELDKIPCQITTWKGWVAQHPKSRSLMMTRTMDRYEKSFYKDLGKFVIIHSSLGRARAWRLSDLNTSSVVNDTFGKRPLLVVYDARTTSAQVYARSRPEHPTLTFTAIDNDTMTDAETGSTWRRNSATAVAGPLKGQALTPLVGVMAFAKAWDSFYPNGTLWSPKR
jgi:hypothetical protein